MQNLEPNRLTFLRRGSPDLSDGRLKLHYPTLAAQLSRKQNKQKTRLIPIS